LDRYPSVQTLPQTRKQALIDRAVPLHALYPLHFELTALKVRLRSGRQRRRFAGAENLRVNVGAGAAGHPGWVNVDIHDAPHVNCLYDARRSLPFPTGSVEFLYSEHFLEHIDYVSDVPRFLADCHRVMSPGGTIRVIVPDLEKYARAYCEGDWDALRTVRGMKDGGFEDPWFPVRFDTPMEMLNFLFRQLAPEPHAYGYDHATLTQVLHAAGFRNILRRGFGEGPHPELLLDKPSRRSESLYVEAVR